MTPTAFDILWYLPLFPTFPQKLGADFDLETKPGVTLAELTSTGRQNVPAFLEEMPGGWKKFQGVWNSSRWVGILPGGLEEFQVSWKKFQVGWKIFQKAGISSKKLEDLPKSWNFFQKAGISSRNLDKIHQT